MVIEDYQTLGERFHVLFFLQKQCQCTLTWEEETSPNPGISSSCQIIWPAEEKEKTTSVTSLKKFHGWRPRKKNKVSSVSLKETVIAESSNSSEIL